MVSTISQFFRSAVWQRLTSWLALICFAGYALTTAASAGASPATTYSPDTSTVRAATPAYQPLLLQGIDLNPDDPLQINFVFSRGDSWLTPAQQYAEAQRLIHYFLTALTIPNADLWVNLNPREPHRIIPDTLAQTEMGRDLLLEDYRLKQYSASLLHPDTPTGKLYWELLTDLPRTTPTTPRTPIDSCNRIWIMPDTATIYQKPGSVRITDSRLKVLTEEELLAVDRDLSERVGTQTTNRPEEFSAVAAVRQAVVPTVDQAVNEGRRFARVRQIYHAAILASWFKLTLQNHILNQVYTDKNKLAGIDLVDMDMRQKIFARYAHAFRTGALDLIREERDPVSQQLIPRKYFAGGFDLEEIATFNDDDTEPGYRKQQLKFAATLKPETSPSPDAGYHTDFLRYMFITTDSHSSYYPLAQWKALIKVLQNSRNPRFKISNFNIKPGLADNGSLRRMLSLLNVWEIDKGDPDKDLLYRLATPDQMNELTTITNTTIVLKTLQRIIAAADTAHRDNIFTFTPESIIQELKTSTQSLYGPGLEVQEVSEVLSTNTHLFTFNNQTVSWSVMKDSFQEFMQPTLSEWEKKQRQAFYDLLVGKKHFEDPTTVISAGEIHNFLDRIMAHLNDGQQKLDITNSPPETVALVQELFSQPPFWLLSDAMVPKKEKKSSYYILATPSSLYQTRSLFIEALMLAWINTKNIQNFSQSDLISTIEHFKGFQRNQLIPDTKIFRTILIDWKKQGIIVSRDEEGNTSWNLNQPKIAALTSGASAPLPDSSYADKKGGIIVDPVLSRTTTVNALTPSFSTTANWSTLPEILTNSHFTGFSVKLQPPSHSAP